MPPLTATVMDGPPLIVRGLKSLPGVERLARAVEDFAGVGGVVAHRLTDLTHASGVYSMGPWFGLPASGAGTTRSSLIHLSLLRLKAGCDPNG